LKPAAQLGGFDRAGVRCECVHSGREARFEAVSLVVVASRTPGDRLFRALFAQPRALVGAGIDHIGDCEAPGLIADAVFAGHRLARDFGESAEPDLSYERELPAW